MATYVISDIHGQYDMFIELLDKIQPQDTDNALHIRGHTGSGTTSDKDTYETYGNAKCYMHSWQPCVYGVRMSGIFDEGNYRYVHRGIG